ncbi:MAG: imidazole glycerol phosphate synthase subunit HisH [Elusimicrobia bacterium]|nr:imidazole glycerol phosphate synthase subunit HisH [Elusimicrobiota bacterium]
MSRTLKAAIVDYQLGNLFSVKHACDRTGMQAQITADKDDISAADLVILPGVGAFGDAMATLNKLDLVSYLRDLALSGKPFLGICLGMQLLMSKSYEFAEHTGLGIMEGDVLPLNRATASKVPQVGWNKIHLTQAARQDGSFLNNLADGDYMYFVHSFYVKPNNPQVILSSTRYGDIEFCSSFRQGNVLGCQFHPERSGPQGLRIYYNLSLSF